MQKYKVVKTVREHGNQNGRIVRLVLDRLYNYSVRHDIEQLKSLADQGLLWSDIPPFTSPYSSNKEVKVKIFLNHFGHWVAETEGDNTRLNNLLLLPIEGQLYNPRALY